MSPIFWLRSENRLRAVWRFAAAGLVFALLLFLLQALVSLILRISPGLVQGTADQMAASGQFWVEPSAVDYASRLLRAAEQFVNWPLNSLVMLAVCLGGLAIAGRLLDRRSFADFGFHFQRGWWADFGFGLFLGAFLIGLIFLVERALGWVRVESIFPAAVMPAWLIVSLGLLNYVQVAVLEETLLRSYVLRNLAEGLHLGRITPRAALLTAYVISSSLFGLLHLGNDNTTWLSTLNLMLFGLFFGLGYIFTGELAIPIGFHLTWNFFQGFIFGFPVSGTGTATSFLAIQQSGPELLTGGAFGPEGGLVGILAIALGCVLVLLWLRWRHGGARLQERLAVYRRADSGEQAA